MTGFGTGTAPLPSGRVTVEVRTVNQRFLDVRVAAPREYGAWEATCRELVRARVARGRVDVLVARNAPPSGRARVVLDLAAARDWAAAWRKLKQALALAGELELGLFRETDVFQPVQLPGDVRAEFPGAERALAQALERLDGERRREGANLQRDMRQRVERLAAIERILRTHTAAALSEAQARLTERVQRLLRGHEVDAGRIAQEAALLAERGDVTEERVRLASHLSALRALIAGPTPAGKQIEFLLQEVHREINTIGSKVSNLAVTQLVIEAKGEVERLREQVQNVE
jgi:uncharacterized protein (TIGR00255 family)